MGVGVGGVEATVDGTSVGAAVGAAVGAVVGAGVGLDVGATLPPHPATRAAPSHSAIANERLATIHLQVERTVAGQGIRNTTWTVIVTSVEPGRTGVSAALSPAPCAAP